ncbi:prepilin-type N-terminal cleavage/methylation domain-containing protein [bacterium]|nr:prepilin-type N-terminal cleavage/methylation domain-containing protein [bacterium]
MVYKVRKNDLGITQPQVFRVSKNGAGFTLIEIVIALAVFTVGIMAAFTLSLSNINNARDNYNRVVAANLAREGLEMVRNTRDNNWRLIDDNQLCGSDLCLWNNDLDGNFLTVEYTGNLNSNICLGDTSLNDCACVADRSCLLYSNVDNFYDHDTNGTDTNMYRVIHLLDICLDEGPPTVESTILGSDSCDNYGLDHIGIVATARVSWNDGSNVKYVDVAETFYNWRR